MHGKANRKIQSTSLHNLIRKTLKYLFLVVTAYDKLTYIKVSFIEITHS